MRVCLCAEKAADKSLHMLEMVKAGPAGVRVC